MKKSLLFFMLLFTVSILTMETHAVQVYNLISGVTSEQESAKAPEISVTATANSYTVIVNVEEVVFKQDELYPGTYFVELEGFGQTTETGKPSLPVKSELFMIPEGKRPIITPTKMAYKTLSKRVAPGRASLLETEANYTTANVPAIASYTGFQSNDLAALGTIQRYRGRRFMTADIIPARYSMSANSLQIFTRLVFTITFEDMPDEDYTGYLEPIHNWKSDNFWNYCNRLNDINIDDDLFLISGENEAKDYLIITTPELVPAAETFVEWKKQEGYNCTILAEASRTVASTKAEIANFASSHPKFAALLILGDVTLIPCCRVQGLYGTQDLFDSDMPYACLDGGNDNYPDIIYGRIPATSLLQANDVFSKIIAYESNSKITEMPMFNPPTLKGLHIGIFQHDYTNTSKDSRDYIETCENILSAVTGEGISVTRLYYAPDYCSPKYYQKGATMPEYLQKPQYSWSVTPSDIITACRSVNYVLYRGHGDYDGWYSREGSLILTSSLNQFTQRYWYPVVFSIACSTGELTRRVDDNGELLPESWATQLLTLSSTAGASGVFAATRPSLTVCNDLLAKGLFQHLFPTATLVGSIGEALSWETIGEAIASGFNYMSKNYKNKDHCDYQRRMYHWLGDPTMYMHTGKIEPLGGIGVSYGIPYTTVSCTEDDVHITGLYSNGSVYSYQKNNASFWTSGCEYIVITGRNKVPKKIALADYADDSRINVSMLKSAFYKNNMLHVSYTLLQKDASSLIYIPDAAGTLTITSITGDVMGTFSCPIIQSSITVDCSAYPKGTYVVSLKLYNKDCGSATVIKSI